MPPILGGDGILLMLDRRQQNKQHSIMASVNEVVSMGGRRLRAKLMWLSVSIR